MREMVEGVRTEGARPSAEPGLGWHQRARCRGVLNNYNIPLYFNVSNYFTVYN